MMDSRVRLRPGRGRGDRRRRRPPRLWLQMSTATVYAHRFDAAQRRGHRRASAAPNPACRATGPTASRSRRPGSGAQEQADTPHTRKVALRSAMVMSPDRGGVFDVLLRLARLGLGGPVAGGAQYVSWIHDRDFVRAVEFLADRDDLAGPVNLAAPDPAPAARRSCARCAPRGASRWACPRRGGWPSSARSRCARTPNSC